MHRAFREIHHVTQVLIYGTATAESDSAKWGKGDRTYYYPEWTKVSAGPDWKTRLR